MAKSKKEEKLVDQEEINVEKMIQETEKHSKRNIMILIVLFTLSLATIFYIFYSFPTLSTADKEKLWRVPRNIDDVRTIHSVFVKYAESNYYHVLLAFISLYIFLQTFAIPGPVILSILSGALFGGIQGFFLVCFCATFGASCCYGISYVLGKNLVLKCVPGMVVKFHKQLQKQKDNLLWYMLFLRITPLLPNWFINISSPILGIPYLYFFLATFFGLMPLNIIHIKTGLILSEAEKIGGFDIKSIAMLFGIGFIALIPTLFKKKLREKVE